MRLIMNRIRKGVRSTALAVITLACADGVASDLTGPALTDQGGDASRIASIAVTLPQSSLEVGKSIQATAIVLDRWNRQVSRDVTWSTTDSTIAIVSAAGLVTG